VKPFYRATSLPCQLFHTRRHIDDDTARVASVCCSLTAPQGTHELPSVISTTDSLTNYLRGSITRRFIIYKTPSPVHPPPPQSLATLTKIHSDPVLHVGHGFPSGFFTSGFSIFFNILLFISVSVYLVFDMLAHELVHDSVCTVTTPDWFIIFVGYMQQALSVYI
jgi:hypothetical protein